MGMVQTIETESGETLVVLTRRDYDALLARAGDEDAEDRMTSSSPPRRAREATARGRLCCDLTGRQRAQGTAPYWRGLTQVDVTTAAGLTQGYLSELESGAKTGSAGYTLARLATCLDVPVGWLGEAVA